jgi:hypothetical protein
MSGEHSWTDSVSGYMLSQEYLFNSGRLYFDVQTTCPALVAPLCSGGPIGKHHFPGSGRDETAEWAVMPLGWRLASLHHHFRRDLSGFVPLAPGDGLVVQLPMASGGDYWVFSGGTGPRNLSFGIDPGAASGQWVCS